MCAIRSKQKQSYVGHYAGALAFVATCTDDLTPSELRRNLGVDHLGVHQLAFLRNQLTKEKFGECQCARRTRRFAQPPAVNGLCTRSKAITYRREWLVNTPTLLHFVKAHMGKRAAGKNVLRIQACCCQPQQWPPGWRRRNCKVGVSRLKKLDVCNNNVGDLGAKTCADHQASTEVQSAANTMYLNLCGAPGRFFEAVPGCAWAVRSAPPFGAGGD